MTTLFDVDAAGPGRASTVDTIAANTASNDAELQRQFERTVAPLLGTLHHVAWKLTGNASDAEDLLQDTMVRAYRAFPALQSQSHMKAWFVRIMRNIWIDDHRRNERRPIEWLSGDVGDGGLFTDYSRQQSTRDAVESQLIGPSRDTEVRSAFRSLPGYLRRAMYYAYVDGYSYKEIAEMESIPVGTVMSRLYRARRRMRVLLADRVPSSENDELANDADPHVLTETATMARS